MIYYVTIFILSIFCFEANSADYIKTPSKLEPLERVSSSDPLKAEDSIPSPKKPVKLEPLVKSSKVESAFSAVDSFGSVESYPSDTESTTSAESLADFPVKVIEDKAQEKAGEGFSPLEFLLTKKVKRLMKEGEFTPEAVLEMLRPRPEAPEVFAVSSKLYSLDGTPRPEAIRVIEGGEDIKGSSTSALFLVQVNTRFLREDAGMPTDDTVVRPGIRFLKELSGADWQTKIVIKFLKSKGTTRKDGVRKVSFESIAKEQLKNLEKIKASKLAHINYFKNPALPRMTFDEASYYYIVDGSKQYFSILHGAKGVPFSTIWKDYEDKKIGIDQLEESAYAIGKALGSFHVHTKMPKNIHSSDDFGSYTPIAHGDFYWQNIFYDFKTKRVYFIDNESMAKSFEIPQPVETDFLRFYSHQLFGSYPNSEKCNINRCSHEDIKIIYRAFFRGYIQAYPETLQPMLTNYIKKVVFEFNELVKGVVLPKDEGSPSETTKEIQPTEGEIKLQLLFDGIFSE